MISPLPRCVGPSAEDAHARGTDAGLCDVRTARPPPRALLYPRIPLRASSMHVCVEDAQRMRMPLMRGIGPCALAASPRTSIHRLPMDGCPSAPPRSAGFLKSVNVRVGIEKRAGTAGSVMGKDTTRRSYGVRGYSAQARIVACRHFQTAQEHVREPWSVSAQRVHL